VSPHPRHQLGFFILRPNFSLHQRDQNRTCSSGRPASFAGALRLLAANFHRIRQSLQRFVSRRCSSDSLCTIFFRMFVTGHEFIRAATTEAFSGFQPLHKIIQTDCVAPASSRQPPRPSRFRTKPPLTPLSAIHTPQNAVSPLSAIHTEKGGKGGAAS
jgi:hypothetical protein